VPAASTPAWPAGWPRPRGSGDRSAARAHRPRRGRLPGPAMRRGPQRRRRGGRAFGYSYAFSRGQAPGEYWCCSMVYHQLTSFNSPGRQFAAARGSEYRDVSIKVRTGQPLDSSGRCRRAGWIPACNPVAGGSRRPPGCVPRNGTSHDVPFAIEFRQPCRHLRHRDVQRPVHRSDRQLAGSRTSSSRKSSPAARRSTNSAGVIWSIMAQNLKASGWRALIMGGITVSNSASLTHWSSPTRVTRRASITGARPTTTNSRPPGLSARSKRGS